MPDPTIHDLAPSDPDEMATVLGINEANVPEVGELDPERLAYLVDESDIAVCVRVDEAIAGFSLVLGPGSAYGSVNYRWFADHHPTAMYLDRVAFDAAHQGRGLGTLLYAEIDRRIRADHPAATGLGLEVNVDPPNEASLRFHHKLGFVEVGRHVSKGIEVSLMLRPLGTTASD